MQTENGAVFDMYGFPNQMSYYLGLSGQKLDSLVDGSPDKIVRIWWIAAELATVLAGEGFL